ncbi:MAG: hypothetical protein HC907_12405 [Richelia sp. SM1_7_0]|nr:hypothetical protein [Richelia sp. SM1_7_0]
MSLSTSRKIILPSAIACGIVFAVLTVPLAVMGENEVAIRFEEESFFNGKLRDVAAPYVVFATLLSFGAGISVAALTGLQHLNRNSLNDKQKLARLEKDLQEKERLLQEFKLSESRLQASGLKSFLNE